MAGFQQEFQMDELGRDIRLATGREKAGLLRRREFMEESYAMQEGRRGVEEERATQVGEWETARFELQKTHFEATVQLQEQQYQMNLEHIEERYSLEKERIEAQKAYIQEMWALEDRQRELQNAWQDRQQQYQLEMAERQKSYYEEVVFVNMEAQHTKAVANHEAQVGYYDIIHANQLTAQGLEEDNALAIANHILYQIQQYQPGGALYDAFHEFVNSILVKLGALEEDKGVGMGESQNLGYNPTMTIEDAFVGNAQNMRQALDGMEIRIRDDAGQGFNGIIVTTMNAELSRKTQVGAWGNPWSSPGAGCDE